MYLKVSTKNNFTLKMPALTFGHKESADLPYLLQGLPQPSIPYG